MLVIDCQSMERIKDIGSEHCSKYDLLCSTEERKSYSLEQHEGESIMTECLFLGLFGEISAQQGIFPLFLGYNKQFKWILKDLNFAFDFMPWNGPMYAQLFMTMN